MEDKVDLEIRELQQRLSHNSIKLWLAGLGIVMALGGIAAERIAAYEQRSHEAELQRIQHRVQRMTKIASEFDSLYADTIQAIREAKTDSFFLGGSLSGLIDRIPNCSESCKPINDFKSYAQKLRAKLNNKSETVELREWSRAIELQAIWESRTEAFTPDFQIYFGKSMATEAELVAKNAWQALNQQFNILAVGDSQPLATFRKTGAALSKNLRTAITIKQLTRSVSE